MSGITSLFQYDFMRNASDYHTAVWHSWYYDRQ